MRIRTMFDGIRAARAGDSRRALLGHQPVGRDRGVLAGTELLERLGPLAFISTHFLDYARELAESDAGRGPRVPAGRVDADQNSTYQFVGGVAETSLAGVMAERLGVTFEELAAVIDRRSSRAKRADATRRQVAHASGLRRAKKTRPLRPERTGEKVCSFDVRALVGDAVLQALAGLEEGVGLASDGDRRAGGWIAALAAPRYLVPKVPKPGSETLRPASSSTAMMPVPAWCRRCSSRPPLPSPGSGHTCSQLCRHFALVHESSSDSIVRAEGRSFARASPKPVLSVGQMYQANVPCKGPIATFFGLRRR